MEQVSRDCRPVFLLPDRFWKWHERMWRHKCERLFDVDRTLPSAILSLAVSSLALLTWVMWLLRRSSLPLAFRCGVVCVAVGAWLFVVFWTGFCVTVEECIPM